MNRSASEAIPSKRKLYLLQSLYHEKHPPLTDVLLPKTYTHERQKLRRIDLIRTPDRRPKS